MQYLLFGLLALALFLLTARAFAAANPAALARQLRVGAGLAALAGGGVFALRGAMTYGLWMTALGSWLLWGGRVWRWPGWSGQANPQAHQSSRVVTDHLDVALDHESGSIHGRVLRGFFKDRDLESLRPVELAHLWSDCQFADPASAQILEAYLDRIHPTWRDDMARSSAGQTGDGDARPGKRADGRMSQDEALDILGLKAGASEDEIRHAHRELMLKVHPDRGGSHTLAAAVNEAKDVLLGGR